VFELNAAGHDAAERLRRGNQAYEALFEKVAAIRHEWDTPDVNDLIDRVYAEWPEFTEKSLIRHEVAERSRRYSD
jgi:hypothetical protein